VLANEVIPFGLEFEAGCILNALSHVIRFTSHLTLSNPVFNGV